MLMISDDIASINVLQHGANIMEWGSVADWLGGIGGAGGAGSAAAFYLMDRLRHAKEKDAAERNEEANRVIIVDEFRKTVASSLQSLSEIEERHGVTESAWAYHNGILANYQARLRELASAAARDIGLQLAIGRAAHSLAFSNLPLEHADFWFENVAIAEGELEASLDMLGGNGA